jgi:hypothetical protein
MPTGRRRPVRAATMISRMTRVQIFAAFFILAALAVLDICPFAVTCHRIRPCLIDLIWQR